MKKKFSSYLLMGKVATLPFLAQSARAQVTPAYTDITTGTLSIIQLPDTQGQIKLQTLTTDVAASTSTAKTYASALLCPSMSTSALPSSMSVVVTGVNAGDTVYLAAALNKNVPGYKSLNPRMTIGDSGLTILGFASVTGSQSGTTSAITIPVNLTANSAFVNAGTFYMQAVSIPTGKESDAASWRFTELDQVSVGAIVRNSYGAITSYCS